MSEPTEQEMLHAAAALSPFARRWRLPLNLPLGAIDKAVEEQIDEHEAGARRLAEAMQADLDRRASPQMINRYPLYQKGILSPGCVGVANTSKARPFFHPGPDLPTRHAWSRFSPRRWRP